MILEQTPTNRIDRRSPVGEARLLRSTSALLILALASTADAQTVIAPADADIACKNDEVLLSVWTAQGVVSSINYDDSGGMVRVDSRRWQRLSADAQARIGLAAFCHVAYHFGHGKITVAAYPAGQVFGSVTDGVWHNRLGGP
jgi:hypothetical protein